MLKIFVQQKVNVSIHEIENKLRDNLIKICVVKRDPTPADILQRLRYVFKKLFIK